MSGYAHWYNLDLPETMAVREKLLPESGTISQITMSAMEDWGSEISEQNVPVLIVIEGLTMYLSERNIQRIFTVISSRFSNATVFVETMNPTIVRHFKEKSIDASNAKFNWGIKNGKTLAELLPDFRFVEEHSLTEGMAAFAPVYKLLDRLPAVRNISNKIIVLEKEL
jgi:O-methyltransferase involved in polyketide biosynthesis